MSLIKGPFFRLLALWMAAATSSLPVPVSPRTRTLKSMEATFTISPLVNVMASLVPTMEVKLSLGVF